MQTSSVAAKVRHLFGLCKEFEEKVWKWRRFLTDVGCGRYKMRHLQTKVGHLHTKGHGERYVGSLFRVDEPVPDDSYKIVTKEHVYRTRICGGLDIFL